MSLWSSKGTLLVLQRDVGCHRGPPKGHCWSASGILVSCCHCWVPPWSSKGALSVLQRDIDVTVVLQRDIVGCHNGPPKGHWCHCELWVSPWSSNGTLLVLQRDVGCHCGPPTGHCWSSNGILVSYCHHWVSNSVLQRDTVGPPKGRWMSPWSSKGTLLVLQRDVGCHCGPPTGHCWSSNEILVSCCHCWVSLWSSKGTLSVLQRDIDATVVLQGDTVSPPRGHCWSSRGTTWGVSVVLQSPPPPPAPP